MNEQKGSGLVPYINMYVNGVLWGGGFITICVIVRHLFHVGMNG